MTMCKVVEKFGTTGHYPHTDCRMTATGSEAGCENHRLYTIDYRAMTET